MDAVYPSDLNDSEWAVLRPLLRRARLGTGSREVDFRTVRNGQPFQIASMIWRRGGRISTFAVRTGSVVAVRLICRYLIRCPTLPAFCRRLNRAIRLPRSNSVTVYANWGHRGPRPPPIEPQLWRNRPRLPDPSFSTRKRTQSPFGATTLGGLVSGLMPDMSAMQNLALHCRHLERLL